MNLIPESSKENPVHPNRENILNHKRNLVEKVAEKMYNTFGGNNQNEETFENIKNDSVQNIQEDSRQSRLGLNEELIVLFLMKLKY